VYRDLLTDLLQYSGSISFSFDNMSLLGII